jgi:hypothetical protein
MKKCEKCGNEFPFIVKIDGKTHNLNSRKFCLNCSPFNKHNTKKLSSLPADFTKKICTKCGIEKEIEAFYTLKNGRKHSNCIKCQRIKNKQKPREIKRRCIEYKGCKCQICGYSTYQGSLDFHHLDSDEKKFSIGHRHMRNFENLIPELDKCILVCKNCHCEIHAGITIIPNEFKNG